MKHFFTKASGQLRPKIFGPQIATLFVKKPPNALKFGAQMA